MHPDLTLLIAAERHADLDATRDSSSAPEDDAVRIAAQSRREAELQKYGLRRPTRLAVLLPLRSSA